MIKDFISAMRGVICGVLGNSYINGGRVSDPVPPTWTKFYSQN